MLIPQRPPFRMIDHIKYDDNTGFFNGYKTLTETEKQCCKMLLAEGLGQTVEYNIRSIYSLYKNRLLLGRIDWLEYYKRINLNEKYIFKVNAISRCNSFFSSTVSAYSSLSEEKCAMMKLVHILNDEVYNE